MKKLRFISLILTAVMLFAAAVPVNAAPKVGDPIGDVLYTDIVAYIDGHAIRSYNINWNTYIVVEDLLMYGFSVVWFGAEKKLVIYPERTAAPENYTADYTPGKSGGKNGEVAMPYLYTDITTWIGNNKVEAYNIGGFTCMCIDDLAAVFSETYTYDNASRTLRMTSPKFGSSAPVPSDKPTVPDTDGDAESALITAAKKFLNDYIEDFTDFDATDIAEFGKLGDIYGDSLVSDYMQLLAELYSVLDCDINDVSLVPGGAELDVTVTARNLEGVLSAAFTEALIEMSLKVNNGASYTDEEVTALIVNKLFLKIGNDKLQTKKFNVTVSVDIDKKGNITLDTEKNADLVNAMLGGILNDPILGK